MDEYKAEVNDKWGKTDAYKEYTEKAKHHSKDTQKKLAGEMDAILAEFAACMKQSETPDSAEPQALVEKLQNHISEHYYLCTKEILAGLGQMYVADERFRDNIDKHGSGTAAFIREAIGIYCGN